MLFPAGHLVRFILVTGLFFLWGIPHNLNDVLIRQFMKSFAITRLQAGLVPRVLEGFRAVHSNFRIGKIVMAEEFRRANDLDMVKNFEECFGKTPTIFEPHSQFKQRAPLAIGLIRTGDTTQYANIILESA